MNRNINVRNSSIIIFFITLATFLSSVMMMVSGTLLAQPTLKELLKEPAEEGQVTDQSKTESKKPDIPLADASSVLVGEMVVAIGNPFGLKHTLTNGLISARDRKLPKKVKGSENLFLQTSALINPGNSGGPLINLRGEVVGVNMAIVAGSQGIGFAVPIDLVKEIVPHLMRSGKVEPGRRRRGS